MTKRNNAIHFVKVMLTDEHGTLLDTFDVAATSTVVTSRALRDAVEMKFDVIDDDDDDDGRTP